MDGGNSWSGWRFLGANVLGLHGKPTEWRTKLIGCGSGDNPGGYIFRTTVGIVLRLIVLQISLRRWITVILGQ
jgi:hypothetical protein